MRRVVVVALVAVLLAACADDDPTPAEPSLAATPAVSESPTPSEDPGVERLVVPAAAASLPDSWSESFVIPYGQGPALLGTSQGGDSGGTVLYGPEYGAAAPDGTWWFLDLAKDRIAHYDATGRYLGRVRNTTPSTLPHVLADGTFYAARYNTDTSSQLLRLRDGALDVVDVDGAFFPSYDDGTSLFGDVDNEMAEVNPASGVLERVDYFTTPPGARFAVHTDFDKGRLLVDLPDAAVSRSLPIRTTSGDKAHVGIEVRAGADGVLHLFLSGYGDDDESGQLVGYTSISTSGAVSPVVGMPDPFSESDPGSPAHLVIAPGSSKPMLVYVLGDGVHVYERVGA
jgi:hypothetical protein